MTGYLVIQVHLHEGRYHGAAPWPPSPSRLFQALVAGAGLSGPLDEHDRRALEWLESLDAPVIGAPHRREGQSVTMYVPGNDLDKVGGDPRRTGVIRDRKAVTPQLFDAAHPFFYAWTVADVDGGAGEADQISALADRLYQFGHGVDFAWAWGALLDRPALDELVAGYRGTLFHPSPGGPGDGLACPCAGSLRSLEHRYAAYAHRFATEGKTRVFSKPPAARFGSVPYDSPPARYLYELRERSSGAPFAPWAPTRASRLVTWLRDASVDRLRHALPARSAEIDRVLVGRKPDGSNDGPTSARVRIIPLPSIGHSHADRQVRRVLVEVPPDCPLRAEDVNWAFSGLEVVDRTTGEVLDVVLTPAQDATARPMLAHYGLAEDALYRRWRTVSPAALPVDSAGRPKSGGERGRKMAHAAQAVLQALRHVGVRGTPVSLSVQREPFEGHGERAEAFAPGARFGKDRLWHVEIGFSEGIEAPLVIGDGRFLGLGLMAPVSGSRVEATDGGQLLEESTA